MQLERMTTHTRPAARTPHWVVVDAQGERLGRLASRVANALQGKHRADYSRHQIAGDFVIVVNASKIGISGNKRSHKVYYQHTGYLGNLKTRTFEEMVERFPQRVIEKAVKGMLPRNRLGRQMLRRLKVYSGATHPHEAQVNAGQGKAKQAPSAPATRSRRKQEPSSAVSATAKAEAQAAVATRHAEEAEEAAAAAAIENAAEEAGAEETEAAEAASSQTDQETSNSENEEEKA
jgi:large subunit ribosomal protein L13